MERSPRIHIVFNSAEERRITEPIIVHDPDRLYYFTAHIKSTGQSDEHMDFFENNTNFLKEKIPKMEIIQKAVDYADYIEIIQELSKIIKKEREKNITSEILVNISSGSKITALASTEASMIWNCKTYYVHSTHYNPLLGPRHDGEMIIFKPVMFPIQKPRKNLIDVLKIIDEMIENKYKKKISACSTKFIYKKDLKNILLEKGYIALKKRNENPRNMASSHYMKLNHAYLNPLSLELKCIEISDDKRNKKIYLTPTGKNMLEIFKYLI